MDEGVKAARGPGRKPLSASVKRSALLQFRCRLSEAKLFARAAGARGKKLPDWFRDVLTKEARKIIRRRRPR